MIETSIWNTITTLGAATARAIVVWLLVSWAVALMLYFGSVIPLRRMIRVKA